MRTEPDIVVRLRDSRYDNGCNAKEAAAEIERLRTENAELRRDAERWNWLRAQPMYQIWKGLAAAENRNEVIDAWRSAAIDEAMGKERG